MRRKLAHPKQPSLPRPTGTGKSSDAGEGFFLFLGYGGLYTIYRYRGHLAWRVAGPRLVSGCDLKAVIPAVEK